MSTQSQHPARTVLRTLVQVGIPLALAVPIVWQIITSELERNGVAVPDQLAAVMGAIILGIGIVTAVVTRIMAIPAVNDLLQRIPGLPIAAEPTAPRHRAEPNQD